MSSEDFSTPAVVRFEKRGSWLLFKQRPMESGADGVEGPGSALPQFSASFVERCQGLERKERELHWAFAWASGMPSLAAEELSALFLLISLLRRWHAEGWVSGN
jgi:hypothetical protein